MLVAGQTVPPPEISAVHPAGGAPQSSVTVTVPEVAAEQLELSRRFNYFKEIGWSGGFTYLTPEGLETFSPKFLRLLENIQDIDHMINTLDWKDRSEKQ